MCETWSLRFSTRSPISWKFKKLKKYLIYLAPCVSLFIGCSFWADPSDFERFLWFAMSFAMSHRKSQKSLKKHVWLLRKATPHLPTPYPLKNNFIWWDGVGRGCSLVDHVNEKIKNIRIVSGLSLSDTKDLYSFNRSLVKRNRRNTSIWKQPFRLDVQCTISLSHSPAYRASSDFMDTPHQRNFRHKLSVTELWTVCSHV